MYSRSVTVIRSKRITAAVFRVPPYTSGLQPPSSEVFFSSSLGVYTEAGLKFPMPNILARRRRVAEQGRSPLLVPAWGKLLLFLCCLVPAGESVASDSWGAAMFKTKRHDYGHVVLGANAEFHFELTNIYDREVRLTSVRSSCGCSTAKFSGTLLKPGETGAVIAHLNTSGQYLRDKSAVLTVQLETMTGNSRRTDMVQLFVAGYIRPDVVLTPGSVEFGTVSEGTSVVRTVLMEYTGRSDWALLRIERSQPYIHAKAEEVRRERGNVVYRITATLRDNAPAGYVKDILRFTTNESQPGTSEPVEILLPVQGVITAPIYAKPSPLLVGVLAPGEIATKSIVVRSDTPFRITNVMTEDKRFRFTFSDQESTVQLVSVIFSAGEFSSVQPQDVAKVIRIFTNDLRQNPITLRAFVRVMPMP